MNCLFRKRHRCRGFLLLIERRFWFSWFNCRYCLIWNFWKKFPIQNLKWYYFYEFSSSQKRLCSRLSWQMLWCWILNGLSWPRFLLTSVFWKYFDYYFLLNVKRSHCETRCQVNWMEEVIIYQCGTCRLITSRLRCRISIDWTTYIVINSDSINACKGVIYKKKYCIF